MPKESYLELKVGLFVILALILLTVFILLIGDFSIFQKGDDYKIIFNNANGVKTSAPVRVAGVSTGLVKDVSLFFDSKENMTKVRILIWVKQGTKIPIDSQIMINQLGLFGEKYIEIRPGLDMKNYFHPGQEMIGIEPVIQEEISRKIMDAATKVEQGIAGINDVITDPVNRESLKMTLEHLNSVTGSLRQILTQIESGQGTVGKLLYEKSIYEDLQSLTADIKANPWKLLYRPKSQKSKR